MTQTEIGTWLAVRREAAGLTQDDVAAKIGRGAGLISKWERGSPRMSAESFLELVALYGAAQELVKWLGAYGTRAMAPARRVAEPGHIVPVLKGQVRVTAPAAKKEATRGRR